MWKAHGKDDGQIFWDHPELGAGRPGWHIECTLINYLKFPKGTDIHTGGVDLIFPHHTNEIAQAQALYRPFVNYWMHNEHILVENKKMSKSLGNFYTLSDLEQQQQISGLDLRYLYLQAHYRSKLNVTKESLLAAKNGLTELRKKVGALVAEKSPNASSAEPNQKIITQFRAAINDDLDTPKALAIMFELLGSLELPTAEKIATIFKMDEALGLNLENTYQIQPENLKTAKLPAEIRKLMEKRDQAKAEKAFKLADQLRAEIESRGFELTDSATGTTVRSTSNDNASKNA